jgi:hypothetical protein
LLRIGRIVIGHVLDFDSDCRELLRLNVIPRGWTR